MNIYLDRKKKLREKMKNYRLKHLKSDVVPDLNLHLLHTNDSGYVRFYHRSYAYRGDKYTWARVDGDKLIIKRAKAEKMTTEFKNEMIEFCSRYGIDFTDIKCGEFVEWNQKSTTPSTEVEGLDAVKGVKHENR